LTHKFIDDTTLMEIMQGNYLTHMETFVNEFVQQAIQQNMKVNGGKTKEMLIGPVAKNPPQQLALGGAKVDRVDTFKLFGVHISWDLKWTKHMDAISTKAASRLHFLKQLKRTGLLISDLLCFYAAIVCPVVEYACPVWHSSLTAAQSEKLESLQRWVLQIIYDDSKYSNYNMLLVLAKIKSLKDRREDLIAQFFKKRVLPTNSLLNYLLPPKCDTELTDKLRNAKLYQPEKSHTDRFRKSFIPCSLAVYQQFYSFYLS